MKALERGAVAAFEMKMHEVIKLFDELEVECQIKCQNLIELLELSRRVAEWKLKLAADKNAPFIFCKWPEFSCCQSWVC